ncbi:MAG: SGNH/GDSL hydrolase family protein [Pseudobutyrivibrio sp.]|nr:SGNH/GDSL hydrolase family protein [Pseudobutyrivibrio sp.]
MKKKIVIALWISLIALIIAFGSLVVYQNKLEAEEARIEQEAQEEADKKAAEEEAAKKAAEEEKKKAEEAKLDENGYSYTDYEATMYAVSKATVRELPNDTADIIGTLSVDTIVKIVAKCDQEDYYKIAVNGDYGYISFDDVSEDYIDIPLPKADKAIPTATKDILFIGNSITKYPHTEDWWGSNWGCGATTAANDYVHLTVAAKGYTSYDAMSMRAWEFSNTRNYELDDIDPYITNYQYSTIVIELGENVKGHENHFKEDFTDMISYIRQYNPHARIVILDNFWKYDSIISTKKAVASETGCTFVSLAGVQGVADYQLQVGDTYTDGTGVTYTIGTFLAGHPNDAGFAAIAEKLIAAL